MSKEGIVLEERAGVISYCEGRAEIGSRRGSCRKVLDSCTGSLSWMTSRIPCFEPPHLLRCWAHSRYSFKAHWAAIKPQPGVTHFEYTLFLSPQKLPSRTELPLFSFEPGTRHTCTLLSTPGKGEGLTWALYWNIMFYSVSSIFLIS